MQLYFERYYYWGIYEELILEFKEYYADNLIDNADELRKLLIKSEKLDKKIKNLYNE